MKEDTGVRVSEFLDGELDRDELSQLIEESRDAETQQTLQRYARIGHAMRGESDQYSSIDVSQAVANAIEDVEQAADSTPAAVRDSSTGWLNNNWFKPALGAAFASVVAVVTVMVNQNAVDNTGSGIPVVAEQQVAPKNYQLTEFVRSSSVDETASEAREELNNYLVNHARSASGNNYQGMVPYVRAVAYEPGQKK